MIRRLPLKFSIILATIIFNLGVLPQLVLSHTLLLTQQNNSPSTTNKSQCPQDISQLADLLVNDISNYGNRILQTSRKSLTKPDILPTFIVTASQPDLQPLIIKQRQYQNQKSSEIEQIFFTTLEREYTNNNQIIERQNYHWLLLTTTDKGWTMVMLLTRFGSINDDYLPTPPRDSSNGVIGQAVKLWLRDCQQE